jgi:hypothetical protein
MDQTTLNIIVVGLSFALYFGIAIWARAGSTSEFYAAGRGVNPVVNGMATAADWMSAASFISMAGLIAFTGYTNSLFLMGWTGGYVLDGHAARSRTCGSSASTRCRNSSVTATTPDLCASSWLWSSASSSSPLTYVMRPDDVVSGVVPSRGSSSVETSTMGSLHRNRRSSSSTRFSAA